MGRLLPVRRAGAVCDRARTVNVKCVVVFIHLRSFVRAAIVCTAATEKFIALCKGTRARVSRPSAAATPPYPHHQRQPSATLPPPAPWKHQQSVRYALETQGDCLRTCRPAPTICSPATPSCHPLLSTTQACAPSASPSAFASTTSVSSTLTTSPSGRIVQKSSRDPAWFVIKSTISNRKNRILDRKSGFLIGNQDSSIEN